MDIHTCTHVDEPVAAAVAAVAVAAGDTTASSGAAPDSQEARWEAGLG